jgi:hypothetical protein
MVGERGLVERGAEGFGQRSSRTIFSLGGHVTMIAPLATRSAVAHARCRFAAVAAAAMTLAWSASARAEGSTDYCQKVSARAESDSALMFAPTLHAQVIRYPNSGPADTSGFQVGRGVQPRAAVSINLVDVYKGFGVLDVARKDCLRQASAAPLEEVVLQRAEIGRLPALERKLAFLREHAGEVEEVVRNAEERFAAHTSTLTELQDLRLHALEFKRKIAEIERDIAVIKSRGTTPPSASIPDAVRTYEQRSIDFENSASHVRNLAPWKLSVTAGMTGSPEVDAFGVAELSYNVGGLFQAGAERRAVEARANELKNARYEMRQQVEAVSRELRVSAEHERAQAKAIDDELARIARERAALEGTDAANKHTVLAAMLLEKIDLEAERTFLVTLADKQSAFGGTK